MKNSHVRSSGIEPRFFILLTVRRPPQLIVWNVASDYLDRNSNLLSGTTSSTYVQFKQCFDKLTTTTLAGERLSNNLICKVDGQVHSFEYIFYICTAICINCWQCCILFGRLVESWKLFFNHPVICFDTKFSYQPMRCW